MSKTTMFEAILVHRPDTPPTQLVLLFHGVGAQPQDLVPLGQALARQWPTACVVSVRSPDPSDLGRGWQWFSVIGVSEANRPARVAATLPRFVETVRHWQQQTGLDAANTTLVGFSQGAIMALESTQQPQPLAAAVVAIAGRFAQPPRSSPGRTRIHLMHGDADPVMPTRLAEDAQRQLEALQARVTLDVFPDLGHGIDPRVLDAIARRLQDGALAPAGPAG
ncbi:esterase [Hydrogenophaga sp.]|uniref:esterase n=1 Tax=Hydrogenophaga sp. TaxID=1904254 RepID=UPI00272FB242|nr:esterase [Hydrogenophaga sp.]MDP2017147.1 esterase [Hydrogenophaga sp.]